MHRRQFLQGALASGVILAHPQAGALGMEPAPQLHPMELGLLIKPARAPEEIIGRVHQLGFSTCFLSLDDYIGKFNKHLASQLKGLLDKYAITPTAAEVVGPGRLKWDFLEGPTTIGIVPKATRVERMDALKQLSDFVTVLGIPQIQTHCGFIPENPSDSLYEEVVLAIRELADHCAGNHQSFLMETGQETPTTVRRTIKNVDRPNLGVGLDTANLILYGKANPVDAADLLGPYIRSVHAKDGNWPTDPDQLGKEVLIGKGLVDFRAVFSKLRKAGYTGAITIERETSGPKQIEDVRQEKIYLEQVLQEIQSQPA